MNRLEFGQYAHGRGDYVALREEGLFVRNGDIRLGWRWSKDGASLVADEFVKVPHVEGDTWVSRDGTEVVRYHQGTVSVADSISGKVLWSRSKVVAGDGKIFHPTPGHDEVVIATDQLQFLRWGLNSGQPLTTVTQPSDWTLDVSATPQSAHEGSLIHVGVTDPQRQTFAVRLLEWPSGKPYLADIPPEATPPGGFRDVRIEKDHLVFVATDGTEKLWSTRTNRFVGGLPTPIEKHQGFRINATTLNGSGAIAIARGDEPKNGVDQLEGRSVIVSAEPGADGHWTGAKKNFELAQVPVTELQYTRDDRFLLGWSAGGLAVWKPSNGDKLLELRTSSSLARTSCIDVTGNHFALWFNQSLFLGDLNTGRTQALPVTNADRMHCDDQGLTLLRHIAQGEPGQYDAVRLDWTGKELERKPNEKEALLPPTWRVDNLERGASSGGNYRIAEDSTICNQGKCARLGSPLNIRDGRPKQAYVLNGKALLVVSEIGARFMTLDGQRLLGSIVNVGMDGWIYLDADKGEISPLLETHAPQGIRGTSKLEILAGAPGANLHCALGDRVYPWHACATRFEATGTFQRMLTTLK